MSGPRGSSSPRCSIDSSCGPGASSASSGSTSPSVSRIETRRSSIASSRSPGDRGALEMTFRTALCDLLGIDYPIVQSGMGAIAGPELVAEVCRAGGLGILAGLNVPPDDLRAMIRRVRGLTDRPFGVNLWLHKALRPPIDPDTVPAETLDGAQAMLNRFRERLGIPTTATTPGRAPDLVDAPVAVVLEERPPGFPTGPGRPRPRLAQAGPQPGARGRAAG